MITPLFDQNSLRIAFIKNLAKPGKKKDAYVKADLSHCNYDSALIQFHRFAKVDLGKCWGGGKI